MPFFFLGGAPAAPGEGNAPWFVQAFGERFLVANNYKTQKSNIPKMASNFSRSPPAFQSMIVGGPPAVS